MLGGLLIIFGVHLFYFLIQEHISQHWVAIAPIFFFGLGHAIFTTLIPTSAPKMVDSPDQLPIVFSIMKVIEGLAITIFT